MNNRKDYENPTGVTYLFKSYSPTRHTLRVTGWWDIANVWKLRLDGRYRTSICNDDDIFVGNATERREDTQARLSARLRKELDKNLQLELDCTLTNNDSSIRSERYDRSVVSAGVTWNF
jgi:hypothetical protein